MMRLAMAIVARLNLLVMLLLGLAGAAGAADRVALVIGNNDYAYAPKLINAVSDARGVADALRNAGFHVLESYDQDSRAVMDVSEEFVEAVAEAQIGVIYYAGHGIQFEGESYLIPVDVNLEDERDMRRAIPAQYFLQDAARAQNLGIVILDACRDNPFVKQIAESPTLSRSINLGTGLSSVSEVPKKTLIAYATQAGNVALDGSDGNGPYARALMKHLGTPGKDVRLVFGAIRDEVLSLTGGKQEPFTYGSLGAEEVYLVPAVLTVTTGGAVSGAGTENLAVLNIPNLDSLGAIPDDYLAWKRAVFLDSWEPFAAGTSDGVFNVLHVMLEPERVARISPTVALVQAGNRVVDLSQIGTDGIAAVQQALRDLNFYSGVVDGVAGPQTRNALQQFAMLETGNGVLTVATLVRLGERAATRDPRAQLTGTWQGTYHYTDGRPPVSFEMRLVFSQGLISGSVVEPNTFGAPGFNNLYANFTGLVTADTVRWVKKYDGTAGIIHEVIYEGRLDRATNTITGMWSIPPSNTGAFTLTRL